jgi:hypothetical protein
MRARNYGRHDIAAEGWPRLQEVAGPPFDGKAGTVCGKAGVAEDSNPRHEGTALGGCPGQQYLGPSPRDHMCQCPRTNFVSCVRKPGVPCDVERMHSKARQLGREPIGVSADAYHLKRAIQLSRKV